MEDVFDTIKRAAAVRGRHSPLWRWMYRNSVAFSESLTESGGPDWALLAKVFTEHGLTAKGEGAVTAETARQTWYRVRRAKQLAAEKARAAGRKVESGPRPAGNRVAGVRLAPPVEAAGTAPPAAIDAAIQTLRAQRPWLPGKKGTPQ